MVRGMTVFTTNAWMFDQGYDRKRLERELRAGTVRRLRRGVVMAPTDLTPWQLHRVLIEAAAMKINHGTYVGLQSAALMHGLPVRVATSLPVQVFRTMGGRHTTNRLLQATPAVLGPEDIDIVDGVPVTSLRRTVTDLARRLPFPDAVAVVDRALALGLERTQLATPEGFGHARAALAVAFGDPLSESFGESYSRAVMKLANLPMPRLQVKVYDVDGRFLGRPDFDWGAGIVGEFDGAGKYDGSFGIAPSTAIMAEKLRAEDLRDAGFLLVRWTWADLQVPGKVTNRIRRALATRPSRQSPP